MSFGHGVTYIYLGPPSSRDKMGKPKGAFRFPIICMLRFIERAPKTRLSDRWLKVSHLV